jgi:signal recognition particle receptor subunit beta
VLSERVPIVIACNKQDLQFAKKATTVEIELEKEIEELRKVRKATLNDDERQKQRYLETLKKKFSFTELTGVSVKFVECSVKQEELGEIYRFINNAF